MTEFSSQVEERKKVLEQEAKDKKIKFIEYRFEAGKIIQEAIGFESGKVIIKHADKRKKDVVTKNGY
jgi:hypothetical protein